MQLRDYQQRAVDAIGAMLDAGRDPLLIAPTGSGKTVMLASIAVGRDAIALAHRRELVAQLRNAGIEAYTAAGMVARYHTRSSLPYVDTLVIDEAHHVAPDTRYAKLIADLRALNPGMRVLGATATPWRLDGKGLTTFDDHYVAATPRELLESGVLVPYTGFAYRSVETEGIKRVAGDYAQGALGEAAAHPQLLGDIVTRWKQTASGLSTLAFAVNVEHARALAAAFRAEGFDAEHLTGHDSAVYRDELFLALRERRLNVLVNVAIATEGVDIPSLECLILARPTLSETLALQMIGRVLRSHPGKTQARIHDHAQVIMTHGSPYADRDWSPRAERKRAAVSGGGSQQICGECLALMSASAWMCGECGAAMRERREVAAGEGVEVPLEHTDWDRSGTIEGLYRGADHTRHYVDAIGLERHAVLDAAFATKPVGSRVRVTYLGTRTSARGFRYHDYRIERAVPLSARELELLND